MKSIKLVLIGIKDGIYNAISPLEDFYDFSFLTEDKFFELETLDPDVILVSSSTQLKTPFEYIALTRNKFVSSVIFFITDHEVESEILHALDLQVDGVFNIKTSLRIIASTLEARLTRINHLKAYFSDEKKDKPKKEFILNHETQNLQINGKAHPLTPIEYCLLKILKENHNKIVKKEDLLNELWPDAKENKANSLNTHVYNLKHKIPELSDFLRAKKGIGHYLAIPDLLEAGGFDQESKILVLDDDEDIRTILNEILSPEFSNVTLTDDPKKALELLEKEDFDLILLDLYMPKMNGFEFLQKFHQMDKHIPVVICSAYDTHENLEKTKSLGASDFVSKPFQNGDLLKAVKDKIKG